MGDSVGVGLLGCGNVGGALAELIDERGADSAARTGVELRLARVAVPVDAHPPNPSAMPASTRTIERFMATSEEPANNAASDRLPPSSV